MLRDWYWMWYDEWAIRDERRLGYVSDAVHPARVLTIGMYKVPGGANIQSTELDYADGYHYRLAEMHLRFSPKLEYRTRGFGHS